MAENKKKPTKARVGDFLDAMENPRRRADAKKIAAMMRRATGKRATMWGPSMVGFGKYKTGRSCLNINKLEDVDEKALEKLVTDSVKLMRKRYNVKP